jgi:hypothetical protein
LWKAARRHAPIISKSLRRVNRKRRAPHFTEAPASLFINYRLKLHQPLFPAWHFPLIGHPEQEQPQPPPHAEHMLLPFLRLTMSDAAAAPATARTTAAAIIVPAFSASH